MSSAARFLFRGGLAASCLCIGTHCGSSTGDESRNRDAVTAVHAGAPGQAGGPASGGSGGESGSPVSPSGGSGASGGRAGREATSPAGRGAAASGGSAGAAGRAPSGSAGNAGAAGASSPAKGELFSDDFEDGNLTKPSWIDAEPELKGMWSVTSSEGGKVLAQTASVDDWVIAVAGDYRWTDQVVKAKVKLTSEPGKAGVFARVKDLENYYFLYLDGGSNIVLRKRVDNSSNDVMKVKVETQQDVWYTLELSVRGEMLEGYLDGKLLVSGSDGAVKTGGIAVGTADCTAQFDAVSVRN